eukprot:200513-Pleurochrysis_carterae.AAC.4
MPAALIRFARAVSIAREAWRAHRHHKQREAHESAKRLRVVLSIPGAGTLGGREMRGEDENGSSCTVAFGWSF